MKDPNETSDMIDIELAIEANDLAQEINDMLLGKDLIVIGMALFTLLYNSPEIRAALTRANRATVGWISESDVQELQKAQRFPGTN